MEHGALVAMGALAVAGVLGAGGFLSGKTERDSRARVADLQAAGTIEDVPEVGSMAQAARFDPTRFADDVAKDIDAFGLTDASVTDLAEAQASVVAIDEPVTLGRGKNWSGEGVSLVASVEKVKYQEHGATVSAKHAVLTITNERQTPIAYRIDVASAGTESCAVRGARMHNAMALMPGEAAEIVVCAGTSRVLVRRLEILGISELGYYYVSQLPPAAVGYDAVVDQAHRPAKTVQRCSVDVRGIAGWLEDGRTTWADLVDFYSRHNCHRYAFFVEYRRSDAPLSRLPVAPP